MSSAFALSCLSRLLIGLLWRSGVRSLVVSPGSRSTPYLSAALELTQLHKHLVVDERSAAYVAMGLARAQNRPVALLCTSGTAAANYLPAVVEARLTSTPLVLVTADRPLTLQACSAPQTIDQARIFGSHVLAAVSIALPRLIPQELLQLRRQILSTVALGQGPDGGPVHLNLHTPKPLELVDPVDGDQIATHALVRDLIADVEAPRPWEAPKLSEPTLDRLVSVVDSERRGLITCGFDPEHPRLDPLALARFARTCGYPILLDAAHPLRLDVPAELRPYLAVPYEPLLRLDSWWQSQSPRVLLQIGRPLTSSRFERYLDEQRHASNIHTHLLLARSGWPDPSGRAELLGWGDLNDALERASARLEISPPRSSGWAARWFRAARIVQTCVTSSLKAAEADLPVLGELRAVSTLLDALPKGSRLVVGNSLAIRNIDFLATAQHTGIVVEALRGASGIDGVVSTAVGFALAGDRPTTLLIGDVSFLHDVGGLWSALTIESPLAIVVINNGGGRIFEHLPVAQAIQSDALAFWTTPHHCDLSAAARLYGVSYGHVSSSGELTEALQLAHSHPAVSIIEVAVAPHSAQARSLTIVESLSTALTHAGLLSEYESN